jgi:hypothetical protein
MYVTDFILASTIAEPQNDQITPIFQANLFPPVIILYSHVT